MAISPHGPSAQAFVGAVLALAVATTASAQGGPPVDLEGTHFRCYIVSSQTPQAATTVTLDDQFPGATELSIDEPLQFCVPTSKNGLEIEEPDWHLTMYGAAANLTPHRLIRAEDQFGVRVFEAVGARVLLVPTFKNVPPIEPPEDLNHYWCYEVTDERVRQTVTLEDQFGSDKVRVERPKLFCNPVEKTSAAGVFPMEDEKLHLTCYEIKGPQRTAATTVPVENQFETDLFTVTAWELLCAPSEKLSDTPIP